MVKESFQLESSPLETFSPNPQPDLHIYLDDIVDHTIPDVSIESYLDPYDLIGHLEQSTMNV